MAKMKVKMAQDLQQRLKKKQMAKIESDAMFLGNEESKMEMFLPNMDVEELMEQTEMEFEREKAHESAAIMQELFDDTKNENDGDHANPVEAIGSLKTKGFFYFALEQFADAVERFNKAQELAVNLDPLTALSCVELCASIALGKGKAQVGLRYAISFLCGLDAFFLLCVITPSRILSQCYIFFLF